MINKYTKLKNKHGKLINDFPQFFAFSDEQFKDGLKKLNTTKGKILSIGYSGFIKITDKEKYIEMWKQINSESKAALQDEEYLYQAFRYELSNHEFSYTYDYEDTLDYFNLKYEDLTQKQLSILERAKTDYLKGCEGY